VLHERRETTLSLRTSSPYVSARVGGEDWDGLAPQPAETYQLETSVPRAARLQSTVPYENLYGKKPEVTWPLRVQLIPQDEHGLAIDSAEFDTDLSGNLPCCPQVGHDITLRVGSAFEDWTVVSVSWGVPFPSEGQMTPCSLVHVFLRKLPEAAGPSPAPPGT
jgi:hypothetical protein